MSLNQQFKNMCSVRHAARLTIIFGMLIIIGFSQNIIDFSYSQYQLNTRNDRIKGTEITIPPSKDIFVSYSFPDACYWSTKLAVRDNSVDKQIQTLDVDDYVNTLKNAFIELLKIGERIRHKESNLQQIKQKGGLSNNLNFTLIPQNNMDTLLKHENRLREIDRQIKQNTRILQDLVRKSIQNSDNNQFTKAALQFQIDSLKLKRQFLKSSLRDVQKQKSMEIVTDYQRYFRQLQQRFNDENSLIQDLDVILANYNEIGALKQKISSTKNKIEIATVMLEEKQVCADEIIQIRKLQKNHQEIKSLMANLRQKKRDSSNLNNKYCDGVTKKLQSRLKNVLLSYDYTFQCAEGKDKLKLQIQADKKILDDAQRRLEELENNAGIDDYKTKFQKNREYVKQKHRQVEYFKINPYHHDPNELRALLKKTEQQLSQAIENQKKITAPAEQNINDFKRIHELVNSIKKLKGNYCKQYDNYEVISNQMFQKLHKYEANISYEKKMIELYLQEKKQVNELKQQFEELRSRLQQKIGK